MKKSKEEILTNSYYAIFVQDDDDIYGINGGFFLGFFQKYGEKFVKVESYSSIVFDAIEVFKNKKTAEKYIEEISALRFRSRCTLIKTDSQDFISRITH